MNFLWNSRFSLKDQTAKRGAERVLLAVFCVFVALLIAVGAGASTLLPAMAAEFTAYDRSSIEDDLRDVDISAYPANASGRHFLMDEVGFMEYGYSESSFIVDNYFGIYFYVYNPTEREVSTRAGANVVNMATAYNEAGEPTNYENVPITVLDCTDNHRFYKFRITDGAAVYERAHAYAQAHGGVRRYDIAGIQLWFLGDDGAEADNSEDESVARTYTCTGYAEGCGSDGSEPGDLVIHEERLTVVELEVGQTYWRSNSINQNGANHYNQVNSVYFAIPEEAVVKYGELWGVTCRWDERRTSPILVTNDGELESTFKKWLGQKTGITDRFAVYDTYSGSIGGGMPASDWGWGYGYSVNENTGEVNDVGGVAITKDDTPPGWVFRSNESTVLNTRISSADMLAWASSHGFASYLFTSDVDEGRTYGEQEHTFYADEPFDLLTFNATASGWDKFLLGWQQFWSFGKPDYDWGIGNATVDPIKRVTDADFSGTEEINADNLLVHDLDYGTFKAYYDEHKEDAVYLLRFAVTDYYAAQATVVTDAEWWNPGSWGSGTLDTTSTYMARETVFLDFEIIELTFNKNGNLTVLAAVMSPIDIISGIDPPAYAGFDWTLVWWLVGIALGTVVVGVVGGILESAAKK